MARRIKSGVYDQEREKEREGKRRSGKKKEFKEEQ